MNANRAFWQRRNRWLAVVAIIVLATAVFEIVTGVVLYWLRTGMPMVRIGSITLTAHVYVGLAALPFVAIKLALTWVRLFSLLPTTRVARLDLWATRLLIVLVVGVNLSGLQLQYQVPEAPKWIMAQVHLWLTYAMLVPILWHLQRYLAPTLVWLGFTKASRQVAGPSRVRRRLLWGGAMLASSMVALRLPATLSEPGQRAANNQAMVASVADSIDTPGSASLPPGQTTAVVGDSTAHRSIPIVNASDVAAARAGTEACAPAEGANNFPVTGYRTAGGVIDAAAWRLKIVGDVDRPLSLSYDDILKLPQLRYTYMLECPLSFEVTRQWGGVPLMQLLELAQASPDFRFIIVKGDDGYDVTHLRTKLERPSTMICTHVNCVPLTEEHGFPMRLMMAGVDGGRCVKWVYEIEVRIKA